MLKKVKLVHGNIRFIDYKDEVNINENKSRYNDFIQLFNLGNKFDRLSTIDKIEIKNYFDKIENKNQCLNILNDFDYLVLFITQKFDNNLIINKEQAKEIKEAIKLEMTEEQEKEIKNIQDKEKQQKQKIEEEKKKNIKDINLKTKNYNSSNEFNDLLKVDKNDNFKIGKLMDIIIFSENLMFYNIIKNEMKFLNQDLIETQKNDINEYFKNERLLTKEVLAEAIRRYILRFLLKEKDLEKQNNKRNFIKEIEIIEDLWNIEINKEENKKLKNNSIEKLNKINLSLGQIIQFYDFIEGDKLIENELKEIKENEKNDENPILDVDIDNDNDISDKKEEKGGIEIKENEEEKEKEKEKEKEEEKEGEEEENPDKNNSDEEKSKSDDDKDESESEKDKSDKSDNDD